MDMPNIHWTTLFAAIGVIVVVLFIYHKVVAK